jgi:MiaB-like tRNA modifying enzyme
MQLRKKAALHNLGCKVNAYETEAMQQMLEKNGYEIIPFKEGADIYVINTCTVTNIADRKSRQMLHKAKKMNPEAIVIATGCYAQSSKEILEVDEAIDIVIGNNKKQNLIEIINAYEEGKKQTDAVIDISCTNEFEELSLENTGGHTRAYIKVQDGCNQFCSYCIIPFARGRVRSRNIAEIIKEVQRLVENGYKEVILTGIHLSSYGIDIKDEQGKQTEDLLSLVLTLHELKGLERIRLGSLEPRIITKEFVTITSKLEKFCPHFHLSLQSGCDETLKRMNRRYTSSEYYQTCELLREYFVKPAITTDVIVGFPGETEEEFQITKAFLEKVKLYETHIFKYSKRKGTKAADMPNQVAEQIKTKRSNLLQELNEKNQSAFEDGMMGKEVTVLLEEQVTIEGQIYNQGYTKEYVKVAVKSPIDLVNQIVSGEISDVINDHILEVKV